MTIDTDVSRRSHAITMSKAIRTPAGEALTAVMLDFFRCNSLLLTAGDRLVAPLGLTSARWQVLGAIVAAKHPQPVAWLARDMGGNRQNLQRIINDLEKDGLVAFEANPHHRRAQLVVMTPKGKKAFDAAMHLQAPWINRLSQGLSVKDIETVRRMIAALRVNIERSEAGEKALPRSISHKLQKQHAEAGRSQRDNENCRARGLVAL